MNPAAHNESDDEIKDISLKAIITTEISLFQKDKGCQLCDDDGHYLCPLQWWKLNSTVVETQQGQVSTCLGACASNFINSINFCSF
jgi:hypothetical protein